MRRSGSPTRCGPTSAAATCSKGSSPTRNAIGGLAASPRPCPREYGEQTKSQAASPKPPMTRVLSGVVLGVVALALIWFLDSTALLGVALGVCALAFHEYERIVEKIGVKLPYWTALLATLFACAMVPYQWIDIESVLAASLLLVALTVLASSRVGVPLLAD